MSVNICTWSCTCWKKRCKRLSDQSPISHWTSGPPGCRATSTSNGHFLDRKYVRATPSGYRGKVWTTRGIALWTHAQCAQLLALSSLDTGLELTRYSWHSARSIVDLCTPLALFTADYVLLVFLGRTTSVRCRKVMGNPRCRIVHGHG